MAQLTIRTTDELARRVRAEAAAQHRSMNEYVTLVLDAATSADLAGDEAARIRARLSQAGLLVETTPRPSRPSPEQVAAARAAAAGGTPLSDLVDSGRG